MGLAPDHFPYSCSFPGRTLHRVEIVALADAPELQSTVSVEVREDKVWVCVKGKEKDEKESRECKQGTIRKKGGVLHGEEEQRQEQAERLERQWGGGDVTPGESRADSGTGIAAAACNAAPTVAQWRCASPRRLFVVAALTTCRKERERESDALVDLGRVLGRSCS